MISETQQQSSSPVVNVDALKQHVLVNHFTNATGCNCDQATQLLTDARWDFELALSMFFQETSVPHQNGRTGINPLCAPCNTPATPPSFGDALMALSKLACNATQQTGTPNSGTLNQAQFHTGTTPNTLNNHHVLHDVNPIDNSRSYTPPCDEMMECTGGGMEEQDDDWYIDRQPAPANNPLYHQENGPLHHVSAPIHMPHSITSNY